MAGLWAPELRSSFLALEPRHAIDLLRVCALLACLLLRTLCLWGMDVEWGCC